MGYLEIKGDSKETMKKMCLQIFALVWEVIASNR